MTAFTGLALRKGRLIDAELCPIDPPDGSSKSAAGRGQEPTGIFAPVGDTPQETFQVCVLVSVYPCWRAGAP
jgi:hypothetical protein